MEQRIDKWKAKELQAKRNAEKKRSAPPSTAGVQVQTSTTTTAQNVTPSSSTTTTKPSRVQTEAYAPFFDTDDEELEMV